MIESSSQDEGKLTISNHLLDIGAIYNFTVTASTYFDDRTASDSVSYEIVEGVGSTVDFEFDLDVINPDWAFFIIAYVYFVDSV